MAAPTEKVVPEVEDLLSTETALDMVANEQVNNTYTANERHAGKVASPPLPPLDATHWGEIVQVLTGELGAAVWAAQHAAYIANENGYIVLAFHPDADKHLQSARLKELGSTLAQHYGTHPQLKTVAWQPHYVSARQHKQQRMENAQQHALSILHNDPQAQRIQHTFGGQWLTDSVESFD